MNENKYLQSTETERHVAMDTELYDLSFILCNSEVKEPIRRQKLKLSMWSKKSKTTYYFH